jgi:hypothetical protein
MRNISFSVLILSLTACAATRTANRAPASEAAPIVCLGDDKLGEEVFADALIRDGDHVVLKGDLIVSANDLKQGFFQGDEMPGGGSCQFTPSSAVKDMLKGNKSTVLPGKTEMAISSLTPIRKNSFGRSGVSFQMVRVGDNVPLFDCSCTDKGVRWVNQTMNDRNYFDYLICGASQKKKNSPVYSDQGDPDGPTEAPAAPAQ